MQFFFWIAFLLVMGIAVFSVQNSNAPPIVMKFFFWSFETSLVYTLLGSFSLGIFVTLLFWIPGTLGFDSSQEAEEGAGGSSGKTDPTGYNESCGSNA